MQSTIDTCPNCGASLAMCHNCGHHLLTPVARLGRDLRTAAATLSADEARFLVDDYYAFQEARKRSRAQERALGESGEPHLIITHFAEQSSTMEKQLERALDAYTATHIMGTWMRDTFGIGPVLSAGLLAHLYFGYWCSVCHAHSEERCKQWQESPRKNAKDLPPHEWTPVISLPTSGQIFQFAGIAGDGQHEWLPNTKRPWNQTLKTLCWKIGDSFVKFSNDDRCFYGRVYRERKEYEVANNEAGRLKAHADARLARDIKRGKKSKENEPYHQKGILSPGHIDLRARRYAVKLFLAHLHDEWYEREFGQPAPAPYPIGILGHAHYIPPPQPVSRNDNQPLPKPRRKRRDAAE